MIFKKDENLSVKEKEIICQQCSKIYELEKDKKIEEFSKLICKGCSMEFCFISCVYCQRKTYMKFHQKSSKYNGMNGFNIRCQYKSCDKDFYLTECEKCKRIQKIQDYIKEGDEIICSYEDCKFKYIQVNCPIEGCIEVLSQQKPINNSFASGFLSIHKKSVLYQKINCYYCWKPIVFISDKTHRNKYYECQKVECPYSNCKKTFNRIICHFCSNEMYINDGWYEMGSKIKCNFCDKIFGKILCPSCCKFNVCQGGEEDFFKLGLMKCGICSKQNYMVNCLFCRKLNYFNNKIPTEGQVVKCGYCQHTFNEIFCPFCKMINPFPLADFSFGKIFKCIYLTCFKEFQFSICPNCSTYSSVKELQEAKTLECSNCNLIFRNWECKFCGSTIMEKNPSDDPCQMIKCPAKNCGKIYSFIRCSKCYKLIFSNENENILGKSVKCTHQGCGIYTLKIKCPSCNLKITYSGGEKKTYNEGDNITCPSCHKKFRFEKNNKINYSNLSCLEQIEGSTFDFGVPETDKNFIFKENLFFYRPPLNRNMIISSQFATGMTSENNSIEVNLPQSFNKNLQECIVCHNNLKESVFYPCGHRCTCYNCAVIIFTVNKKCPKCNKDAECIIKKVYE